MLTVACPPSDRGVIGGAPETPGCASHAKRWVLTATILGSSVASIEASVINVALPAIQRGLGASAAEMQWVASAYTLLLASLTLASGAAGDRFGRRGLFASGLAVITLASIAAALVSSATQLIAARALQGVGGALLVPNSLALLAAAFPKAERGRAIGTWSAVTAMTAAGGPILGGYLVDSTSWRAVFLLVVPLALPTLAIALYRVPDVRTGRRAAAIDWWGAATATAALATLVLGIIAFDPVPLLIALVLVAAFVWHERRTAEPMTAPHLLRSPTFVGVNLLTLFLYFAVTGIFFVLPFALVRVHGYSATATGAAYLPFAAIVSVLSRRFGTMADRVGTRALLVAGPLVTAGGCLLFGLPGVGGSYWTTFFLPMALVGLGMAVTVAPLTSAVMSSVDESESGVASGVNNTVARTAALLAVAIVGLIALEVFGSRFSQHLDAIALSPAVRAALAAETHDLGVATLPIGVSDVERLAVVDAAAKAMVSSLRWVSGLAAVLAGLAALAAMALVESAPSRVLAAGTVAAVSCAHLELVLDVAPRSPGCEECLVLGAQWVHLRMCLTCGHVGCCDSSRYRHATAHFWASSHPIVRSLQPGESWRWCYVDDAAV